MKMIYIKPQTETLNVDSQLHIMEGSWNDHADGKEGMFDEEDFDIEEETTQENKDLWNY